MRFLYKKMLKESERNNSPERIVGPEGLTQDSITHAEKLSYGAPEMTPEQIEDQKKAREAMIEIAEAGDAQSAETLKTLEDAQLEAEQLGETAHFPPEITQDAEQSAEYEQAQTDSDIPQARELPPVQNTEVTGALPKPTEKLPFWKRWLNKLK